MHVVVMGCGRVGSSLANSLSRAGHSVAIIDRTATAFSRLAKDFSGTTTVGLGFDQEILKQAGIAHADAFAAVSSGDNSNIIAARVARETFGVPKVVARIYDAKRAAVYERLGIPSIATVPWTTDRFLNELGEGDDALWQDSSCAVSIIELHFHEAWIGTRISDIQENTGARISFILRMGTPILPESRTVLQHDDHVYAAVLSDRITEVRRLVAAIPVESEN